MIVVKLEVTPEKIFRRVVKDMQTKSGLSVTAASKEMGFKGVSVFFCSSSRTKITWFATKFADILLKRANMMKRFSFERYDFESFCKTVGLKEAWVAKELGITRQGLNKLKRTGFPSHRRTEVKYIINKGGVALENLVDVIRDHADLWGD